MDCQDVRALLAFTRRGSDQIDPTERAAIQQHLEACGDCAAASQSEELLDAALGPAMRAVTVPAGLKQRLHARLAADRHWPKLPIAAAAAVLLAVGIGTAVWMMRSPPSFDSAVAHHAINLLPADPDAVEEWYRQRGIDMVTWRQLDHALLWTCDVVEIQGQRVPKLIFSRRDKGALAEVIVLRRDRFNMTDLRSVVANPNRIIVEPSDSDPRYVFLVGTTEDTLQLFLIAGAN